MLSMASGDRIREFREARTPKITQEKLADLAGIKRSRLAQYEAGRTEPPLKVLEMIAKALRVPVANLLDPDQEKDVHHSSPKRLRGEPTGKLKIYGAISAGDGNTSYIDSEEMDVPQQFARDDYGGLIIEGDSMIPFLKSSDIAIFKDWTRPKEGYYMAAELPDGSWVVKKCVYEEGRFILRSLNDAYPDIFTFRLAGFLVGLVRDSGPEREIRLNPYGLLPRPETE